MGTPIDLTESVAGEEDPGASIEPAATPQQRQPPTVAGSVCPRCGGTGKLGASQCPDCGGTGQVIAANGN